MQKIDSPHLASIPSATNFVAIRPMYFAKVQPNKSAEMEKLRRELLRRIMQNEARRRATAEAAPKR